MHDVSPLRSCPRWLALSLSIAIAVGLAGCGGGDKPKKKESAPKKSAASTKSSTPSADTPKPSADAPKVDAKIATAIDDIESGSSVQRKRAIGTLLKARAKLAEAKAKPGGTKLIAVLKDALDDKHWEVRSLACIALLEIQGKDAAMHARKLLKDKDENVRTTIANELGRLGKDYADDLVEALDDESDDLREIVLDHLTQMGNKRAASRVVQLLKNTESDRVRAQALDYLVKTDTASGLSAVIDVVDDLTNPNAVSRAVAYIGKHGTAKQVKEDVVRFIPDDSILVRKAAVAAVVARKCRTGDAVASLINLLGNEEEEVRKLGHEALETLTGQKFGFDPMKEPDESAETIKKWRVWLRENESKLEG